MPNKSLKKPRGMQLRLKKQYWRSRREQLGLRRRLRRLRSKVYRPKLKGLLKRRPRLKRKRRRD